MKNLRKIIMAISVMMALGFISKSVVRTIENCYKNSIELLSKNAAVVAPPMSF